MKRILTIMAAIVCLAACEKPVDTSKIIGTWSECYDDPNFVMDGNVITLKTAATDSAHSPSYTITELDEKEMSCGQDQALGSGSCGHHGSRGYQRTVCGDQLR